MVDPEPAPPPPTRLQKLVRIAKEWGLSLALAAVVFHVVGQLRAPDLDGLAPDFTAEVLDGDPVTLSALRGQPVVLNFWAAWCGPCRAEVPQLRYFADSHPEVVVLGIATDGSPGELRAARAKLGIDYPIVRADDATVSAYGVETLPTTVVVDADGHIVGAHTGIVTLPQLKLMLP